jgi:hypothetical protein
MADASVSRRVGVLVGCWTLVLCSCVVLIVVSRRQLTGSLEGIRARAAVITVPGADLGRAAFPRNGDERDRIAGRLGVDASELEVSRAGDRGPWCLTIHVRRLLADARLYYRVEGGGGRLHESRSCPGS